MQTECSNVMGLHRKSAPFEPANIRNTATAENETRQQTGATAKPYFTTRPIII